MEQFRYHFHREVWFCVEFLTQVICTPGLFTETWCTISWFWTFKKFFFASLDGKLMLSKLGLGKTLQGYVNIDCFDFTEWVSIDRHKPQADRLFQPAKLGVSLENIRTWARNLGEHLWEG